MEEVTRPHSVFIHIHYHIPTLTMPSIPLLLHRYFVKQQDDITALEHLDANALILPDGSTVRHSTHTPVSNASLTLRDPSDHALLNGEVNGQWKAKYVHI